MLLRLCLALPVGQVTRLAARDDTGEPSPSSVGCEHVTGREGFTTASEGVGILWDRPGNHANSGHILFTDGYECHEELIHNPVFLPEDVQRFAELVRARGFDENGKTRDRSRLAGRIKLLHDVVEAGLRQMTEEASSP